MSEVAVLNSLEAREAQFHDTWARSINEVLVDETFEACTAPESQWLLSKAGDLEGRSVLDIGCGAGEASVYLAKKGADTHALDVSPAMLEVVQRVATSHNVNVKTNVGQAEKLPFPDNHFDIVHAANVLHHVDIAKTLAEIHRVLKPGGKLLSWDPLAHNPLINIYRRIAVDVRTPDEHPIKIDELTLFKKQFSSIEFDCFWFFTQWIFINFKLMERADPNKDRYWKKIIREHKRLEPTYRFLKKIDDLILPRLKCLKRHCWNIAIASTK